MTLLFQPYTFSSKDNRTSLQLANRLIVAPMCQYSAENGAASDWHLTHWTNFLNSGASMFTIEATAVTPEGRITPACLGLWDDATETALGNVLGRARRLAPDNVKVCIQLAHAGRKASSAPPWLGGQLLEPKQGGWVPMGPSRIAQRPGEKPPQEMSMQDLQRVKDAFVASAKRASAIGVDAIELHGAHGYLLHEFLSPVANRRPDNYGGSLENRMRFPLEVFDAVRKVTDAVLGVRVSASDWVDNGLTPEEVAVFAQHLKEKDCNFIHVSSGGVAANQVIPNKPLYQVPFARLIREESKLPTIAVGLITEPAQAESILQNGDADMIALARAFLFDPRWGWHAAADLNGVVQANERYWRCLPSESRTIFGETRIAQR
ncbi:MAG: NADH:flavin oxidoreductase/NADH oxidase [Bordetella sp.]|jgi:2,4-dienoyl-CoA reductase-like NADH-dependent reductase (Old Yellow Enzyme family)